MKRIIKSNSEMFSDDILLPLEHEIDKAQEEARKLIRTQETINPTVADHAKCILANLVSCQRTIRTLRKSLY